MNAQQTITKLIAIEMSSGIAADEQRVIREERMNLEAALAAVGHAKNAGQQLSANFPREAERVRKEAEERAHNHLAQRMDEARRVASMWGHSL